MKGFNEFTAAWKSEIDFGAVLMEKVSFMIRDLELRLVSIFYALLIKNASHQ